MDLLTHTEQMILLAVFRLDEEAYGNGIRKYLEETVGRRFSVGAIYVPLERLTKKGLLQTSQGSPTPERGGRSKRLYSITDEGRSALKATKRAQDAMWAGVPELNFAGLRDGGA